MKFESESDRRAWRAYMAAAVNNIGVSNLMTTGGGEGTTYRADYEQAATWCAGLADAALAEERKRRR